MPRWLKIVTGFAAALAVGWLHHGPLGAGERFIDALEARAKLRLRVTNMPAVDVRMERDPLSRTAVVSGAANDFQREGLGSYPGINDRIRTIPGISRVRWEERTCCAEGR